MANDDITDENADTIRIDYPAEFLRQFRLELREIGGRLDEIDERLPDVSIAERRSLMFRLSEWLEVLGTAATDAAGVTRDHVSALTLYLADK